MVHLHRRHQYKVGALIALAILVAPAVGACSSEHATGSAQEQTGGSDTAAAKGEQLKRQFDEAWALTNQRDHEGYRRLYLIADAAISAELALIAEDRLTVLLHDDTAGWIAALAKVDDARLRRYLTSRGLIPNELPAGVQTLLQFQNEVVQKLETLKLEPRERDLARFVVNFYREHPFPDEAP